MQRKALIKALWSQCNGWIGLEKTIATRVSGVGWFTSSSFGQRTFESDEDSDHGGSGDTRPTTPWVRSVISGVDLMRNAKVSERMRDSDSCVRQNMVGKLVQGCMTVQKVLIQLSMVLRLMTVIVKERFEGK